MGNEVLISVENVSFGYGETAVLQGGLLRHRLRRFPRPDRSERLRENHAPPHYPGAFETLAGKNFSLGRRDRPLPPLEPDRLRPTESDQCGPVIPRHGSGNRGHGSPVPKTVSAIPEARRRSRNRPGSKARGDGRAQTAASAALGGQQQGLYRPGDRQHPTSSSSTSRPRRRRETQRGLRMLSS
jgi:hypothetical protein